MRLHACTWGERAKRLKFSCDFLGNITFEFCCANPAYLGSSMLLHICTFWYNMSTSAVASVDSPWF